MGRSLRISASSSEMDRLRIFTVSIMSFLLLPLVSSEKEEVNQALVQFMEKLSPGNIPREVNWGWNSTSDPCNNKWKGIECDGNLQSVRKIRLNKLNLTGTLDAASLCVTRSLFVLSLEDNNISGELSEEISNCKNLRHLYLRGNNFSGKVPRSISKLSNLKRFDISNNEFSGQLPDMSRISGLLTFLAQFNQLSGEIPNFDFSNLEEFNVSYNNLSGPIPDVSGHFNASSFLGNPELCGKPFSNACPTPPAAPEKNSSVKKYLIYSGYAILGLIIVLLLALKLIKVNKDKKEKNAADKISSKTSGTSSESKAGGNRSEYSITSAESGIASSSFVILSDQVVSELRFEDLLRAPAELIGRGKHGSTYGVTLDGGVTVAVKRIKDWEISRDEFEKRMQRIDQVRHANMMPVVAYYCSKQEKLLVYEYQQNGSLFSLLHESQNGQFFDWGSRLSMAASIAEALAFMHERLGDEGIAHGNMKSSNILLNKNMDPCISEYGLMGADNQGQSHLAKTGNSLKDSDPARGSDSSSSKADIYGYGVILLELLTGKLVQKSGFDLAKWVHSVVREEWTVEVFDKELIAEGASEERMVNLLQVALRCLDASPDARPSMRQVAMMINSIKENEENSMSSDV